MKKLISLFLVALLALGANVSAQETEGAGAASGSTIGGIATTNVIIGAVAVGVAIAIIANDDDDALVCDTNEIVSNGQCVCPSGFGIDNGSCIPQTFVCPDDATLVEGNLCVIPPGGLIPGTDTPTSVTFTVPATLFPQ